MSEQLAQLEKKGGGMNETVLWTNASPTSSLGNQVVTLSKSMVDFDYIKVTFRISTTDSSEYSAFADKNLIANSVGGASRPRLTIGTSDSNNAFTNIRVFLKDSDTTMRIADARNSNNGQAVNNYLIPLKIIGCKL